jgi:uncharacterized protein YjdB/GH25 family lysozyme M1 (1,4-beta-N-acetylmuramidase)
MYSDHDGQYDGRGNAGGNKTPGDEPAFYDETDALDTDTVRNRTGRGSSTVPAKKSGKPGGRAEDRLQSGKTPGYADLDDDVELESDMDYEENGRDAYGSDSWEDTETGSGYDADEEEPEEDDEEPVGFGARLKRLSVMDYVVIGTGVAVIALLLIFGLRWSNVRGEKKTVGTYASLGTEFADGAAIGGSKIQAVADALSAKQSASEEASTEATTEEKGQETVELHLSSIYKDLKIKFISQKSAAIITGVPFSVKVTDPSGKTAEYTNDDKDGIIYKQDIAAGKYTVVMEPFDDTDENRNRYSIPSDEQTITVKDSLDYKKVDVTDEIKTESQVNVAKEDTAKQNTTVESVNPDTVEWVESTKTEVTGDDASGVAESGEDYQEVPKSDIPVPAASTTSRRDGMVIAAPAISTMVSADIVAVPTDDGTIETPDPSATDTTTDEHTDQPAQTTVTLDSSSLSGKVGDNPVTLNATVTPEGSSVSWSSSDTNVASVSDGRVSFIGAGTATITVTAGTASATCSVTVAKADVTLDSITLSATSLSGKVGETAQLTATKKYSDSSTSTEKIDWSSENSSIASVDDSGKVTFVAGGSTTIHAKDKDGSISSSCDVTVTAETSYTLTLTPASSTVKAGASTKISTSLSPFKDVTYTWTSSDTAKATVSSDGTVTGAAVGTADITCSTTIDGKTVSAKVTITVAAADAKTITLTPTAVSLSVGGTQQMAAAVSGTADAVLVWSSSDPSVAAVSEAGLITAVKKGTCTIKAALKEDTATAASVAVTVGSNKTALKDKDGNTLYIKDANGKYVAATADDYYTAAQFFKLVSTTKTYKYTGWQTLSGRRYFFDKNGNKVTGSQVIQGAKYTFGDDGALSGGNTLGIDVSKWNGSIDWNAVKNSGVSYVIIRCGYRGSSQGALIEDSRFRANIQGASAAGLKVGVYFFTQAVNEVEAVEEASMALSLVGGYQLSYPIFLDIEGSGGRGDALSSSERTAVAKAFCRTVSNSGYSAGVYANKNWLNSMMSASSLTGYNIWLAQYAAAPTYSTTRYDLWQYSSKGSIAGISGNVDMNLSYLGY